jgi:hypothetical protein
MNHLATLLFGGSQIDAWTARRLRKRRRRFHVQKLRGRLNLAPESARQDKEDWHHGCRLSCLHMYLARHQGIEESAADSRNRASGLG